MASELPSDVVTGEIEDLVDRYQSLSEHERRQKDEAEVRQQFINPLLRALGWDTTTDQVKPEQRTLVGDADYALSLRGQEQFFIEAKRFSVDLDGTRRLRSDEEQSFVEQAIEYAWHQGCDWAVLTNFSELRLYFTHISKDNLDKGLVFDLDASEFVTGEGISKLSNLSKNAVEKGSLGSLERRRERDSVSTEVLNTLSNARLSLTKDIHESEDLKLDELREGVQRILDRLVVMRVAEDRGVINRDTLLIMMETWEDTTINPELGLLIGKLRGIFREFDSVYNSELFAPHECEEYEISNDILKSVVTELYEYNFAYIDADILGSIYEDYLGHAIEQDTAEIVEQSELRYEDGVYYTPVPVVEYTVSSTLGEQIESVMVEVRESLADEPDFETANEQFNQIEEITFLDVSCGSGSFLIKAYDAFRQAYETYKKLLKDAKDGGMAVDSYSSEIHDIPPDYRKKILRNNIFAVDIDQQAAEIASVNLFLKALMQEEKVPTMLQENIKSGNSLLNGTPEYVAEVLDISVEEAREMGAFDWEEEFKSVFEQGGGFTVIAGNPPWGANIESYRGWLEHDDHYQLATGQYDSYDMFLELTSHLLQDNGTLGFIIPDTIFEEEHTNVREWLIDNHTINQIHKLGEGVFEDVFSPAAILQYTKEEPDKDHTIQCSVLRKEDRKKMKGAKGEALNTLIESRENITKQERFKTRDYSFTVFAGEQDYEIMEQMESDTVDTGDVLIDGRGDEIGKTGNIMRCPSCMDWDTYPQSRAASKGGGYYSKTCTHCGHEYEFEEAIETRSIIEDHQPDDSWKKLYFGEHIVRYREGGSQWIDDSVDGIGFKHKSAFEPPKILVRKTGFGFNAMIDYSDARCLQVVYIFQLQDDSEYDAEYFLGFLNSRVMLYYHTKNESEIEWESYPYKTQGMVMDLPYPKVDFDDEDQVEQYDEFVELVRSASQTPGEISREKDWKIERLAMDLYDIPEENRSRIWSELDELQRLQVVRELFPE